jgi:hypothetical protein
MNTSRRGPIDPRLSVAVIGLLMAAVLFVGSAFAAAPTGQGASRTSQAANRQAPNAPEALVVVSPSNMDGWATTNGHCNGGTSTGSVGFVPGPGTPHLGIGSFQFTTGTDGDSFPNIRNANYHGIRLDQINAFSYSTYVQAPITNTGQAPYIILNIDNNGDNTVDDQLFFEPAYQTGTYSGATVPNQCPGNPLCVALNTWQTWDARLGGWWTVANGGPPLVTLQSYAAANPNARIINTGTGLGGLRFVAGCGGSTWANFVGNLDNVSFGYGPAPTPTNTAIPSATNTAAPSSTNTAIPTSTDTAAPTSTATETAVPPSATETGTPTELPSATATETETGTATAFVPSATATETATETPFIPGPNAPEGGGPPSDFTTYDMEPDAATATTTSTSTSTTVPSTTSTTEPSSTTVPSSTSTTVPSATRTNTAVVSSTVTPNATATACAIKFADVPPVGEGSTFYGFVRCLACRHIVSGYPCGAPGEPCNDDDDPYYRPGANVSRGQLSKIVANSAGLNDAIAEGQQQFADVEPGDPFYLFVERLAETGAIAGYPCGEFGPSEPCDDLNRPYFRPNSPATRGQISKIVSIAAGFDEDVPAEQQTFTDVPTDSPFWVYIERLAAREIISGYGEANKCPTGTPCFRYNDLTSRGQMAKIAANAFFPNCQTPARR